MSCPELVGTFQNSPFASRDFLHRVSKLTLISILQNNIFFSVRPVQYLSQDILLFLHEVSMSLEIAAW